MIELCQRKFMRVEVGLRLIEIGLMIGDINQLFYQLRGMSRIFLIKFHKMQTYLIGLPMRV